MAQGSRAGTSVELWENCSQTSHSSIYVHNTTVLNSPPELSESPALRAASGSSERPITESFAWTQDIEDPNSDCENGGCDEDNWADEPLQKIIDENSDVWYIPDTIFNNVAIYTTLVKLLWPITCMMRMSYRGLNIALLVEGQDGLRRPEWIRGKFASGPCTKRYQTHSHNISGLS